MALPTSRDYDAIDTGPLPHTTVNGLQDGVVNLEAARSGERTRMFGLASRMIADFSSPNPPKIFGEYIQLASTAQRLFVFPFNLNYGQRIKKWRTVIHHDITSTHVMGVKLIRWGGVKFPSTRAVNLGYEAVPGQTTLFSDGVVGEDMLESDASPLPLSGGEEWAYGLEFLTVLGGSPAGDIRTHTVALTTDDP